MNRLLDRLHASGIRYCMLRGFESWTAADRHHEVDVLVSPDDLEAWKRLVVDMGFVPIPVPVLGGHRFYTGYDPQADAWLKLDVVTDVRYGGRGRVLVPTGLDSILDRVNGGRPARLGPDDELFTLLLHCILDKFAFKADHRAKLVTLLGEVERDGARHGSVEHLAETVAGGSLRWAEASVAIHRGDWDGLLRRRWHLAWALFRRSPLRTTWHAIHESFLRLMRPILIAWSHRGYAVALVGPDGTGKTSLARHLAASPEIRARVLYMGTHPVPFGFLGRLAEQAARTVVGTFWKVRGAFVVYERHPWEGRELQESGVGARMRRWLLTSVSPHPDLLVVLDASADVLRARTPEHGLDRITRQRERYLRLAKRVDGAALLDTTPSICETGASLTALIWTRYHEHVTGAKVLRQK